MSKYEPPATMNAAVTLGHGGPDMIELRSDWPTPQVGPGQALVKVAAAGVNNTDIWSRRGAYGTADDPDAVVGWRGVPLAFPLIQGIDVVGVVVRVGSSDDEHLIGRKVLVDPITVYENGFPSEIIGSESDGGFAEFHRSPVDRLYDVTASRLTDPQLACLPTAYGTAMGMIRRARCEPGERVMVTGASGGVGLAATQILVARRCVVVAYTSLEKVSTVAAAGPAEVVIRDRDEISTIPEVDAVVDVVGGPEFGAFVDRVRPGGRLVTAGAIAGPVVQFDIRRLYLGQRTLIGSTMHTPDDFAALTDMARSGLVEPLVAEVFPLDEIVTAQRRFEAKDFVGKLVLVP